MRKFQFLGLVSAMGLMYLNSDNGSNVDGAAPHDPLADDATPVVPNVTEAVSTDTAPPAEPVKAKKPTKDKAKREPKAKKRERGRPPVYVGKVKTYLVSLVRKHGLTGARAILNAGNGKKAADLKAQRNLELVPEPLGISMPTLGKFAAAAGVELARGRRAAA